jgi:hypothetical protein
MDVDDRVNHELGLVDIRLAFEATTIVSRWSPAGDLGALNLGLVPDAFVEYLVGGLTFCAFLEYDRGTETLGRPALRAPFAGELEARSRRVLRVVQRDRFLVCPPLRRVAGARGIHQHVASSRQQLRRSAHDSASARFANLTSGGRPR